MLFDCIAFSTPTYKTLHNCRDDVFTVFAHDSIETFHCPGKSFPLPNLLQSVTLESNVRGDVKRDLKKSPMEFYWGNVLALDFQFRRISIDAVYMFNHSAFAGYANHLVMILQLRRRYCIVSLSLFLHSTIFYSLAAHNYIHVQIQKLKVVSKTKVYLFLPRLLKPQLGAHVYDRY